VRERIQRLKEKLFSMDNRTMFLERLFLMKTGYEKYRDERPSVRYALILNEILANISVVIDEDNLIVGRIKETIPTAQEEEALKEIAEYYKSACPEAMNSPKIRVKDWATSGRKKDEEEYLSGALFSSIASLSWFSTAGHITVAWDALLNKGMKGVRDLAQEKLVELDNSPESIKKRQFLEAVTISCDAVINFAKRYEEALTNLATDEEDAERREGLLKVREVVKRVPAHPARSFHEALQSVWFLDLIMHAVCGARDYALGRMDQYLYEYYKTDMERGRLTKDDAIELLQSVFIHTVEVSGLGDQAHGSKAFGYTATLPIKNSR